VQWEGQPLGRPTVSDGTVQRGGTLRFVMAAEPTPPEPYDVSAPSGGRGTGLSPGASTGGGLDAAAAASHEAAAVAAAVAAALAKVSSNGGGSGGGGSGSGLAEAGSRDPVAVAGELAVAAAEAKAEATVAELAELKRSSKALSGSLSEQLDTIQVATPRSSARCRGGAQRLAVAAAAAAAAAADVFSVAVFVICMFA